MNAKRGYVPEDERNFSASALETMRIASRHIDYLINEGYDSKSASTFVGNHFLLSERQRLAIVRSLATKEQLEMRQAQEKKTGTEVWVDGFNMIITLEVLFCDSILFTCMDGTIRDLAALRGTYRIIPETMEATDMLLDVLLESGAESIHILLDEPVSNSGRLKTLIADIGEKYPFMTRFGMELNAANEPDPEVLFGALNEGSSVVEALCNDPQKSFAVTLKFIVTSKSALF